MEVWVDKGKEWGFVLKKVGEKVRFREVDKRRSEMQKAERGVRAEEGE